MSSFVFCLSINNPAFGYLPITGKCKHPEIPRGNIGSLIMRPYNIPLIRGFFYRQFKSFYHTFSSR